MTDNATILASNGTPILIDADMVDALGRHSWHLNNSRGKRYAQRHAMVNGRETKIKLHREVLGLTTGDAAVDHINGDTLDNRRRNLRTCTHQQNQSNKKAQRGHRFKGVYLHKDTNRWAATITSNNVRKHLGLFDTPEQAALAYNAAAVALLDGFRSLNDV